MISVVTTSTVIVTLITRKKTSQRLKMACFSSGLFYSKTVLKVRARLRKKDAMRRYEHQ